MKRGRLTAAMGVAAALACGAARAQMLEVHADGTVVSYEGDSQRLSPGAHPTALIVSAHKRHGRAGATPAPPPAVAAAIHASAERHQIDEGLVTAVAWQESHYRNQAVSRKGARGTMQLMPATARRMGVDSASTEGNIEGGVVYLAQMMQRYDGDTAKALAAYNAGPQRVDRYGGVPPYRETQGYVHSIMGRMGRIGGAEDDLPLKTRMSAQ
ncbi:MAG TPA: lytic transglycosylase domain-containing protein [Caulobacteraceae bacterium]|nr:lytic transglycosylase domain-containing protein [Caulobacteraceae bacterium]